MTGIISDGKISPMSPVKKEDVSGFIERLQPQDAAYERFREVLDDLSRPILAKDTKAVATQDMEEVKRRLHVELLSPAERVLFNEFTLGDVEPYEVNGRTRAEYRKVESIFTRYCFVTKEDVEDMPVDQLKELALRRGVMSIGARIYLARYIEKNGLEGSNQYVGDIHGEYWWNYGDPFQLFHVIEDEGKGRIFQARDSFHYHLTHPHYDVHLAKNFDRFNH